MKCRQSITHFQIVTIYRRTEFYPCQSFFESYPRYVEMKSQSKPGKLVATSNKATKG